MRSPLAARAAVPDESVPRLSPIRQTELVQYRFELVVSQKGIHQHDDQG